MSKPLSLLLLLLVAQRLGALPEQTEILLNGGMEAPFKDGLAAGWVKNCYGSNDVSFAEEPRAFGGGNPPSA